MSKADAVKKKHSRMTWIVGGILGALLVAVVVVVGGAYVYIHFIEGPAPKPLALPKTTTPKKQSGAATTLSSPTGLWKVKSSSTVGYRVNEVLAGQNNVAVGRTHSVSGTMTVDGAGVSGATFTAQMSTVHSDQSQRDNQFDNRIMNVSQYPTATFTVTSPIELSSTPTVGKTVHASATGNLTLHGETHSVTFPVSAVYTGTSIDITGSIPITFATWGISNPSFGSFVTTDNHGILEFLLKMERSAAS
jgi:polyisoprenoid-binding protein YceI